METESKILKIICAHCSKDAQVGLKVHGSAMMEPEDAQVDRLIKYLNRHINEWNKGTYNGNPRT
jgi:hypothetical protein